tara:strand:+ start:95 stop:346 length:252 start_codon:yes stop_codon:yes gene_type:complete
MTSSTDQNNNSEDLVDLSKMSNEEVGKLYIDGLTIYEDQIEMMDFIRKKSTIVRNSLHDLEIELKKRNIKIKPVEEKTEESNE